LDDLRGNVLSPEARGVLKKYGQDPDHPVVGGAAQPTTYKQTATGPNGHKIGSNDGGKTWFDAVNGKQIQ
jgi:hypothetical protein